MQNWERLYSYIQEYQELVLDYYAKHAVAFLVTYWNINKEATVWDDTQLYGGSYEKTGELSGMKWDKYLLLPVYFSEEISTGFDGSEHGLVKDQETTIVIPSVYGITPYANDVVKLEQEFLQAPTDTYPIFKVTGVEVFPNTNKRFWRLRIRVYESKGVEKLDQKTENTYVFFDYDKKIHTVEEATTLARMLSKNKELKSNLVDLWDDNTGLYHR